MIAKEARELIVSMEVSADTMLKAEAMLEIYKDNDEVPEEIINQILKIVDTDFDPNKVVGETDDTDLVI